MEDMERKEQVNGGHGAERAGKWRTWSGETVLKRTGKWRTWSGKGR